MTHTFDGNAIVPLGGGSGSRPNTYTLDVVSAELAVAPRATKKAGSKKAASQKPAAKKGQGQLSLGGLDARPDWSPEALLTRHGGAAAGKK